MQLHFSAGNKIWGISSSGEAPALHAGRSGIDTWILQICLNQLLYFKTCIEIVDSIPLICLSVGKCGRIIFLKIYLSNAIITLLNLQ